MGDDWYPLAGLFTFGVPLCRRQPDRTGGHGATKQASDRPLYQMVVNTVSCRNGDGLRADAA